MGADRGGVRGTCKSSQEEESGGIGELFENEWFRFQLGYHKPSVQCDFIDSETEQTAYCRPYMVGTSFEFSTSNGSLFRRLSGVAAVPREMHWLGNEDRLYVVDEQLRTVIELVGFDIFKGSPLEVRRFRQRLRLPRAFMDVDIPRFWSGEVTEFWKDP